MGVHDRGRADVLLVGPEHRAARRAGGAEDAAARVLEPRAVGRRLAALPAVGGDVRVDEERLDLLVRIPERLHVDEQVLRNAHAADRLDRDPRAGVADEVLAGKPVPPVDQHRVGAADAVRARAAEGERPVLVPLHLVQEVEDPVARLGVDDVFLPVRLEVELGVVAEDPDGDVHQ
jgi:hypothetical protein